MRSIARSTPLFAVLVSAGLASLVVSACSSNNTGTTTGPLTFDTSAAVSGPADTHCGARNQETSQASCHASGPAPSEDAGLPVEDAASPVKDAAPEEGGASADASAGGDAGGDNGGSGYGPTENGSEGDDDDCKYHLKWASTKVTENTDVTFQVTVTKKTESAPLTGGNVDTETFLGDSHIAPDTKPTGKEIGGGVYQVGPIRFDQPGKWTVRFHINEACDDLLGSSPHGHAAFFVNVP
jgi:hypothetical protein